MEKKEVKIIGLELKKNMGILQAHKLEFDSENRLIIIKGSSGAGKTTEQKALQLGTQGSKTLIDKKLYGDIETEVQLLDGDLNVWVGCKSDKTGALVYTLYTKDKNGKIVKEPVIDGVKATPAKYLEALQTKLTWRMDELTSENPTVQRNILLELYQHSLKSLGVIFDKKDPAYKDSILGKIEQAEKTRDEKDALRKQKGGIAEDLKERGFDPDRPDTVPDAVDIDAIEQKIKEQEKQKTIKETEAKSSKDARLDKIKLKAVEFTEKTKKENEAIKAEWERQCKIFECVEYLVKEKIIELDYPSPKEPIYKDGVLELEKLRAEYKEIEAGKVEVDVSEFDNRITELEVEKSKGKFINAIVEAIDSFHLWRSADETVKGLKTQYHKLLVSVDTGVEGLKIVPEDDNIFLMYDGSYDTSYFHNPNKELRKISAYSGTQKPLICLLIQNYLLSQKAKAMRYMYIDNVPLDKKARALIEDMCEKLNLYVFLNITGDFEKSEIKDGEILIEGGEVFFNQAKAVAKDENWDDLPF